MSEKPSASHETTHDDTKEVKDALKKSPGEAAETMAKQEIQRALSGLKIDIGNIIAQESPEKQEAEDLLDGREENPDPIIPKNTPAEVSQSLAQRHERFAQEILNVDAEQYTANVSKLIGQRFPGSIVV